MAFYSTVATATNKPIVGVAPFLSLPSFSTSIRAWPLQGNNFLSLAFSKSLHWNREVFLMKRLSQFSSVVGAESVDQIASLQTNEVLPELLTEYMVDMKCEGCVNSVKNKLETVTGVNNIEVDLENQIVRIRGSSTVKTITETLEQTGRKVRLIGQGSPNDFLISAAVAEFKGPEIFGVVRFAQVSMEMARIEANFSGLNSRRHAWSINQYGDLTKGPLTTGNVYNPNDSTTKQPLGDLGAFDVTEKGEAFYSGVKEKLRITDLIGRSVVIYGAEDKSDNGIAAAVIARSAGVGENYKKVCSCDGTIIWESSNNDFVPSML